MNFKVILLLFTFVVSAQLFAADSSNNEDFKPDMEQEILRQLEQINVMGKSWDQKLKKARSQRNKNSNDEEQLGQVM